MAGLDTRRCLGLSLAAILSACVTPPEPKVAPAPPPATSDAKASTAPPPHFSGEAALTRLEVLMGHSRSLGDPRRSESIEVLAQMLRDAGADTVEQHPFRASDTTTGRQFALVNVFGHLRPGAPRRYLLATHFDTRPWADEEPDRTAHDQPVPGANDGTSGVAVLLELLSMLATELPSDVGISVLLFDGEELGHPGTASSGGYCMGSRAFAQQVAEARPPWFSAAQLGIVLDMVGDRDLNVLVDPRSEDYHLELIVRLWSTAQERGHTQFVEDTRPYSILDDHEFLSQSGVPSVLLIDKDYPPWHTRADTIDKVSAQSLGAVGDTVLHTLLDYANE